ncbi:MAG: type IV toxin-antitoxin system AbiEi family antitoxin domain-containing protein [Egibacteraceae bacterium]
MPPDIGGITRANRRKLQTLHQRAKGPFTAHDAAAWLGVSQESARRLLAYLAERGWLVRVRRGLYVPVPLESRHPGDWTEDPWVVAARLFAPCYVGGWSACEHWGLTDQLFRQLIVVTARRVRHRHEEVQGTPFRVKVLPRAKLFGTRSVWRNEVRVAVSDPSRTVVDLLDDPSMGGGMRLIAEILQEYFAGEHRAHAVLLDYIDNFGNRTVYKRLGYLVESLGVNAPDLVRECLVRQSTGVSKLDPTVKSSGRTISRWRLDVNVTAGGQAET